MTRTIHAVRAGAVILLATTLGACATTQGRDFDDAYAQQIKPGVTTKAEIRARLGRPPLVQTTDDHNNDIWTYAYYKSGSWWWRYDPAGAQQKRLVITFKGDTVEEAKLLQELPPPDPLEQAYRQPLPGDRVASLEALAARVTPSNARTVRLATCGPTHQQLLAVVQQLNRAKVTGFEIPNCGDAPAERVTAPLVTGTLAADSAYLATDRGGRSTMP